MNTQEIESKVIEILKNSALRFRDDINKNVRCFFTEERKEDEIIIHFNLVSDRILEYLLIFKKLKTIAEHIPDVKGYAKLNLRENPYRNLYFSDEHCILGYIYDYIQKENYDEIACYQKFGIILRNPLKLEGIYTINIIYITD